MAKKTFEVLATNGDTHLGGEDFDTRLINYLVDEFKKDQGIDLRNDPLAMQRLKEAAEKSQNRAVFCAADRREPAVHYRRCHRSETHEHQSDSCKTGKPG